MDTVELLEDWPQPGTGNAGSRIQDGRGPVRVAYDTPSETVAVVEFPICLQFGRCSTGRSLKAPQWRGKSIRIGPVTGSREVRVPAAAAVEGPIGSRHRARGSCGSMAEQLARSDGVSAENGHPLETHFAQAHLRYQCRWSSAKSNSTRPGRQRLDQRTLTASGIVPNAVAARRLRPTAPPRTRSVR